MIYYKSKEEVRIIREDLDDDSSGKKECKAAYIVCSYTLNPWELTIKGLNQLVNACVA